MGGFGGVDVAGGEFEVSVGAAELPLQGGESADEVGFGLVGGCEVADVGVV